MPDVLLSLFKQGIIKGFSVGFMPIESRAANDRDIQTYGPSCRRVYTRWKLLEFSVAPLPVNQEALALAVSKSLGKPVKRVVYERPLRLVESCDDGSHDDDDPPPGPARRLIFHRRAA